MKRTNMSSIQQEEPCIRNVAGETRRNKYLGLQPLETKKTKEEITHRCVFLIKSVSSFIKTIKNSVTRKIAVRLNMC